MATSLGTAWIQIKPSLSGVSSSLKKEMAGVSDQIENTGKVSGQRFGNMWSIAAGNLISTGISKVASVITNNLGGAISRTDTINKFPKVMQNWGFSANEAQDAINDLSKYLDGLPTTMDSSVSAIQRMVAVNGDLGRSTSAYKALNNALLATEAVNGGVERSMEQLMQVYASGKMSMQDYKIIMESTPGLMKQVAQSMGMSAEELAYAMGVNNPGSPTVSMQQFLDQVEKLNEEGTGEFASFAEQAKTNTGGIQTSFDNLSARVQAGWQAILNAIGSGTIANILDNVGYAFKQVGVNVAQFIEYVKNNTWAIDVLKISLASLASVAATLTMINLVTGIQRAITSIGGLSKAISALFSGHPIIALVAAVVAALAVFFTQTETGRGLIQKFGSVVDKVFGALGPVFETVGSIFQTVGEIIGTVFGYIGEAIGKFLDIFNELFPTVQPLLVALGNLFKTVGQAVLQILQALMPLFQAVGQVIMTLLPPIIQIIGAILNVVSALIPPLTQIIGAITNIISTIISALMPIIEALMPIIQVILQGVIMGINVIISVITEIINAVSGVINFVMPIVTNIINVITSIIQGLGSFIGGVFNTIGSIVSNVFGGIGNFISGIVNGVRNVFQGLANFIGGIVNNIRGFFDSLGNGIRNIFEGIKSVVSNIFSAIAGIIKAPINGIISGINGVISMINSIQIPDWVPVIGGAHANIGYIPTLATGGLVGGTGTQFSDSNLFALSKGEYVIRASAARQIGYDNLDQMNETGRTTNSTKVEAPIYINGYNRDPEELANMISRKIAFKVKGVLA